MNKIEENKIEENKIEENKIEENKIEENKIEENKIEENKIEDKEQKPKVFEEKKIININLPIIFKPGIKNQITRRNYKNFTNYIKYLIIRKYSRNLYIALRAAEIPGFNIKNEHHNYMDGIDGKYRPFENLQANFHAASGEFNANDEDYPYEHEPLEKTTIKLPTAAYEMLITLYNRWEVKNLSRYIVLLIAEDILRDFEHNVYRQHYDNKWLVWYHKYCLDVEIKKEHCDPTLS